MIALLTERLSQGEGDKADGEEYQRNLDNQGEAEMYLHVYGALLSDRRLAVLNERTLLAEHQIKEKKKRQTQAARNAEAAFFEDEDEIPDIPEDIDVKPEHEELLGELSFKRRILFERLGGRAVKSVSFCRTSRSCVDETDFDRFWWT
jgi:E3 ubiquitin-protein ligase SHPRH